MDIIGLIGALLLIACGLPQLLLIIRKPESYKGLSEGMLWFWFFGLMFMGAFLLDKQGMDIIILLNYGLSLLIVTGIIIFYYIARRKVK